MLKNYINELLKNNKEVVYNKLFNNMEKSFEKNVQQHTDAVMDILHENLEHVLKDMPNINIVGTQKDVEDYQNERKENNHFNIKNMVKYGLPYYYINFAQEATKQGFTEEPFTILNGKNLEEQYKLSLEDPHKKMLLVHKYLGMGHYSGLVVFRDQLDDDFNKKIYFIVQLGGSNGYDQEYSWNEYKVLSQNDVKDQLLSFKEAIQQLINK